MATSSSIEGMVRHGDVHIQLLVSSAIGLQSNIPPQLSFRYGVELSWHRVVILLMVLSPFPSILSIFPCCLIKNLILGKTSWEKASGGKRVQRLGHHPFLMSPMPMMCLSWRSRSSPLVRTSAVLRSVRTYLTAISPCSISSLTAWNLISICLVLS